MATFMQASVFLPELLKIIKIGISKYLARVQNKARPIRSSSYLTIAT